MEKHCRFFNAPESKSLIFMPCHFNCFAISLFATEHSFDSTQTRYGRTEMNNNNNKLANKARSYRESHRRSFGILVERGKVKSTPEHQ